MTAFTAKVASLLDAGKKIRTDWLNALWDNTTYAKERLDTHIHNGTDSALIEIGPNLLRNGSFENSSDGWTLTPYTGGTTAVGATGVMHGVACLAITSTVLANGGGYATSDEYVAVAPGRRYFASTLVNASAANISSKIEIIWYDSAQAHISSSSHALTNTPTSATPIGVVDVAPSSAAYARARVTGGVPSSGSATGTVYFDGVVFNAMSVLMPAIEAGAELCTILSMGTGGGVLEATSTASNTSSYTELFNCRINQSGIYRVSFGLTASGGTAYGKIYKNGSALGTERSTSGSATWTEDFEFKAGDTVQIFSKSPGFAVSATVSSVQLGALSALSVVSWPNSIAVGLR